MSAATKNAFYELHPNKLGRLVRGIDLGKAISEDCKKRIIDVKEQRLKSEE